MGGLKTVIIILIQFNSRQQATKPLLVDGWKTTKEVQGYYPELGNSEPPLFISCLENPTGLPKSTVS